MRIHKSNTARPAAAGNPRQAKGVAVEQRSTLHMEDTGDLFLPSGRNLPSAGLLPHRSPLWPEG